MPHKSALLSNENGAPGLTERAILENSV